MDASQVDTLRQPYSGPMTEEQVSLLRDMQAFIDYCIDNGLSFHAVVGNLAHDVNGILTHQDAKWFLPKVRGFAARKIQTARLALEMADDPEVRRDAGRE